MQNHQFQSTAFIVALLLLAAGPASLVRAQAVITAPRYVDATAGSDANDGATPETAWQSLEKVNAQTFGPGASILFKSGESWEGQLFPQGSGAEDSPIIIDRYGEGPLPAIHGNGIPSTVLLFNAEYWEISNLEITNFEELEEGQSPRRKRGVHIAARDVGEVRHIHLRNLVVHDVNSQLETDDSRYYGGIFFEVLGTTTPTWFDDILVEGCHVYNVDRTGISNDSSWWERGFETEFGDPLENTSTGPDRTHRWVPSTNLVLRDNLIEHIGGNGVIVRVAKNALIEHNRVFFAGEDISGNGMFCFNTDSTLFQFNEVAHTIYNPGDTDARGIDSDYRTKHTIIQYNYLHHNGYGGVVATGGPGGATAVPRFNHGTVIRYNVLVDNQDHVVRMSGKLSETTVHNNIIYTSEAYEGGSNITLVEHGAWSGSWPSHTNYYNNAFVTLGATPRYALGSSLYNSFENNLYWGQPASNQPYDPAAIEADPLFVAPDPDALWEQLSGFMLSDGSPAIDAGREVDGAPALDFFGNPVPVGEAVDIGVHESAAAVSVEGTPPAVVRGKATIYPNPAAGSATLSTDAVQSGVAGVSLFDMLGREVSGWREAVRAGQNRIDIDLNALGLRAGVYFVRITHPDGAVDTARFVVTGAAR